MSEGYHVSDDLERRAYDAHLMRRLLQYIRPYRRWMFLATGLLLVVSVLSNLTPILVMRSVDKFINNPARLSLVSGGATSSTSDSIQRLTQQDLHGLFRMTLLIAALVLIEAVIRYFQMIIVAYVGQRTMMDMRLALFEHLQQMSLRFLDKNPVGRLMSRVTNDVEKIQQTIVSGLVDMISDLMTLAVVLVFMFYINWHLALLVLSPVPFVFITSAIFRKYAQQSFLEVRRKIARVSAYMQENVSGMRIVQLFNREDENYFEFKLRNADHRDEWLLQIRNFAIYFPVVEFLGVLATSLIILYCGIGILRLGHQQSGVASFGTIFAFVFMAERFFGPIRAMADRYNLLLEAMASSERVFQLLDTVPEIQDAPTPHHPEKLTGAVEFHHVWFTYDGVDTTRHGEESSRLLYSQQHSTKQSPPPARKETQWVLRNISFKLTPGERVAIVGHTGAGKTTLINLLSRFYDIQRGSILVDGIDVRDYRQSTLRRNIGIVLQDVFLFNTTVEENIRLGNLDMTNDWVRECARRVNALPFIERLAGCFQYNVGERGNNLSTGQRQLLAFARTLAHDPQILILDEATSSIDTETEMLIQDAIETLLAGRTSIVIAHRLSTIQHADRIIVMHHGEIREMGTHQQLLAQNGLYRTLYELQYKDQNINV